MLVGDCRMDSPGFSATKGTYSFMGTKSEKVVPMEHGDKRQVCFVYLVSSAVCTLTLVKYGLMSLLDYLPGQSQVNKYGSTSILQGTLKHHWQQHQRVRSCNRCSCTNHLNHKYVCNLSHIAGLYMCHTCFHFREAWKIPGSAPLTWRMAQGLQTYC